MLRKLLMIQIGVLLKGIKNDCPLLHLTSGICYEQLQIMKKACVVL